MSQIQPLSQKHTVTVFNDYLFQGCSNHMSLWSAFLWEILWNLKTARTSLHSVEMLSHYTLLVWNIINTIFYAIKNTVCKTNDSLCLFHMIQYFDFVSAVSFLALYRHNMWVIAILEILLHNMFVNMVMNIWVP